MVAARLISGHIKATDGTEIASIILNGWQVLKSTMRAAHAKASLDTTDAAGETSVENDPAGEDASEPSGPMAAFEGAAQDGFRADISAMSNDEMDDSSRDT